MKTKQLQIPVICDGETYIGAIGDKNGEVYHLILLPGDNDAADWQAQMDWAKSIGGDLPNRIEQAMLFAGFKEQFEKDWYWSSHSYEPDNAYAWCQNFYDGTQYDTRKDLNLCRARAVRRVVIE